MVEIRFRDWPHLNYFVVKTSRNSKKQKRTSRNQHVVFVGQSQLANQLAGFPHISCKIIPLVDRLNFLISNSQQSHMTAKRSGEAKLTLLPLLLWPWTATDVASLCSYCQRSTFAWYMATARNYSCAFTLIAATNNPPEIDNENWYTDHKHINILCNNYR